MVSIFIFFLGSIQNERQLLPYFRGIEESNRKILPEADMDPNLHCRTRAHFFWWGTLECLKTTEGKKPKPTETKTSSWVDPRWCGCCRHLLTSTTSQHVGELSSNPPEAVMGYPKVQKAGGEPDVSGEERSPFGLPQADRFGDCFICFSLAPACQVLPP